ncbi:MAG TPA: type I-U CRISPR-associated helicase/endonuclease Cas3 [Phycisphaerales bacterium]|mgnify:CR=1 FL=1|nr:type I-U CRISPR-associated helicase/endonuclease Cas3 [Phycisphaerales bacterium]HMP36004.1 type I-U CRISPR-associated helicase/endonuclease Cas3 [Phycisphaerales bacterium]
MTPLTPDRFVDFFAALHRRSPYPWQRRLAALASSGDWPGQLSLPTGSGKTSVLDIAIFALACSAARPIAERAAPRRIVFCVNRRIIVDEACDRARRIAEALLKAERAPASRPPILVEVARALRIVAGPGARDAGPPLDVLELRGGIHRDNRWARSATQPTVIASTIDQVGSRLLFRGYGVSPGAAPIQAALLAYDSILFLDEAHISAPFLETLRAIESSVSDPRRIAEPLPIRPLRVVPMSATLGNGGTIRVGPAVRFGLDDEDRADKGLARRLGAAKPVRLVGGARGGIEDDVVREVLALLGEAPSVRGGAGPGTTAGQPRAVGVIVNRVRTARAIHDELARRLGARRGAAPAEKGARSSAISLELVIGAMRPLDRDRQVERLRPLIGGARPERSTVPSIVVATQCLEVGADYDFDAMVVECASIDALRQRFGRLNRAGRPIEAEGVVIAGRPMIRDETKLDDTKPLDPIYGNAASRTWNWLASKATGSVVDFGIVAFERLGAGSDFGPLLSPSARSVSPTLLPAHLDGWCQTSERPTPDASIEPFIHGVSLRGEPDVRICLRAELALAADGQPLRTEEWADVVALLPPTAAETIPVPISLFRRWLLGESAKDADLGDAIDGQERPDESAPPSRPTSRVGLIWRGPKDAHLLSESWQLTARASDRLPQCVRAGDVIVLPAATADVALIAHLPDEPDAPPSAGPGGRAPDAPLGVPMDGAVADDGSADPSSPTEASRDPTAALDVAEESFLGSRARVALRLHSALRPPEATGAIAELFDLTDPTRIDWSREQWKDLLRRVAEEPPDVDDSERLASVRRHCKALAKQRSFSVEAYPAEQGFVLIGTALVEASSSLLPSLDDGDELASRRRRSQPVGLAEHTRNVVRQTSAQLDALGLDSARGALLRAAEYHDLGKADERFQALLLGADRVEAAIALAGGGVPLAKSAGSSRHRGDEERARRRAGLPARFRHEMLSAQIAERTDPPLADPSHRDLLIHLIAAHHGHARPFAPVSPDDELPAIALDGVAFGREERAAAVPAHRLDSEVPRRFHALTRRFGWWGLAYLETLLRLADQQASDLEDRAEEGLAEVSSRTPPGLEGSAISPGGRADGHAGGVRAADRRREPGAEASARRCVSLIGLDGANPLAFLAALGVLRGLSGDAGSDRVRIRWEASGGAWRPIVESDDLDEAGILDRLLDRAHATATHPTLCAADNIQFTPEAFASHARECMESDDPDATEYLAALASDAVVTEAGMVADTALRTMSGAGHQHFLRTMRSVLESVDRDHLERTLFAPWDYGDPLRNLSLRFDPLDDRRYALQWSDPSGDPTRATRGSMLGANALAVLGVPLLRVAPAGRSLETTGFTGRGSGDRFWSWPIWTVPVPIDVVRSLLAIEAIVAERPPRGELRPRGIAAVFRSQRITTGKFRNFTPATAV